jgi:polysaccharide export outer membrane protein
MPYALRGRGVQTMFRKALLIIGLAALVACGGNIPSVKSLNNYQDKKQGFAATIDSYVIGPGDILAIHVWKEPDLSKQVSVRLDGKISLPLVDDMEAAGLTCIELRDQLTEKYADYVEVPVVSISLVESRSRRIYILGKIRSPGEYPLQKNMTFLQAVSRAGGLGEWADPSDIRLIRKINGVEKTFSIDYDEIVSGEDLSQNVLLQPDDTIFVP